MRSKPVSGICGLISISLFCIHVANTSDTVYSKSNKNEVANRSNHLEDLHKFVVARTVENVGANVERDVTDSIAEADADHSETYLKGKHGRRKREVHKAAHEDKIPGKNEIIRTHENNLQTTMYEEKNPVKKECSCGPHEESCYFVQEGRKVCGCKRGYSELDGQCVDCSCGPHVRTCEFNKGGKKLCECEEGYSDFKAQCLECSCGPHGERCDFNEGGIKVCTCKYGYTELRGQCVECDCGALGRCEIGNGTKECFCYFGLVWDKEGDGKCTDCGCGRLGKCIIVNGTKECSCGFGSFWDKQGDGNCKGCTCGALAKCEIINGAKECICDNGLFWDKENTGICLDIDECTTMSKPCAENNICLNTLGDYICLCPEGYFRENYHSAAKKTPCVVGSQKGIIISYVFGGIAMLGFFLMIIGLRLARKHKKFCFRVDVQDGYSKELPNT